MRRPTQTLSATEVFLATVLPPKSLPPVPLVYSVWQSCLMIHVYSLVPHPLLHTLMWTLTLILIDTHYCFVYSTPIFIFTDWYDTSCVICDVRQRHGVCVPCGNLSKCKTCLIEHYKWNDHANLCPMCSTPLTSLSQIVYPWLFSGILNKNDLFVFFFSRLAPKTYPLYSWSSWSVNWCCCCCCFCLYFWCCSHHPGCSVIFSPHVLRAFQHSWKSPLCQWRRLFQKTSLLVLSQLEKSATDHFASFTVIFAGNAQRCVRGGEIMYWPFTERVSKYCL